MGIDSLSIFYNQKIPLFIYLSPTKSIAYNILTTTNRLTNDKYIKTGSPIQT